MTPTPDDSLLIIGDANLDFALRVGRYRSEKEHTGPTLATTYEDLECLQDRYPGVLNRIDELSQLMVTTDHSVDCTCMEKLNGPFDLIVYNFPHAGRPDKLKSLRGGDGHPWIKWRHNNLMTFFFRASRQVLNEKGRVCVATGARSHCCNEEDLMIAAKMSGFSLQLKSSLALWTLGNYKRSYGDWRDDEGEEKVEFEGSGNTYRSQDQRQEMVYTFEMQDCEYDDLTVVEAPKVEDVAPHTVSCCCGLVCPPGAKRSHQTKGGHFSTLDKEHKENDKNTPEGKEAHEEAVWNALMDAVMNGQEAMRRHTMGD